MIRKGCLELYAASHMSNKDLPFEAEDFIVHWQIITIVNVPILAGVNKKLSSTQMTQDSMDVHEETVYPFEIWLEFFFNQIYICILKFPDVF